MNMRATCTAIGLLALAAAFLLLPSRPGQAQDPEKPTEAKKDAEPKREFADKTLLELKRLREELDRLIQARQKGGDGIRPPLPPDVPPPPDRKPPPPPFGFPPGAGKPGDLERRLGEIEQKLDSVLRELGNLRRDMGGKKGPPLGEPPVRRPEKDPPPPEKKGRG